MSRPAIIAPKAGGKNHLAHSDEISHSAAAAFAPITLDGYSFCGLRVSDDAWKVLTLGGAWGSQAYESSDLCGNCRRTYAAMLGQPPQATDTGRLVRAEEVKRKIRNAGGIIEIPARAFRVKGSKDTYTVTITRTEGVADTCTCYDSKVHPDVRCKHIIAVYGTIK